MRNFFSCLQGLIRVWFMYSLWMLVMLPLFGDAFCQNFTVGKRQQGVKQATFERFDSTCGIRDVVIIFNHGGMKSLNGKVIMNSTITVKRDITMELTTTIKVDRCKYKESLDSCEHLYNHKVDDYCKMIESDSDLWSPLFGSYVPKFKCPIKKGLYRSTNGTIDVKAMLLFPIDAWYWRVKVEVRDKATNKTVTCMKVETRIALVP